MDYDVIVVGGGPAGLLAARDIAREGCSACVVEEHQEIGYPVKCSGLYSISGLRELGLKLDSGIISNTIKGGRFYSPGGTELLAYSNMERARVVEKKLFDKFLAREAARAGAEIKLKTSVKSLKIKEGVSVSTSGIGGEEEITSELVIGADGLRSNVARWLGISTVKKTVAAAQVEVEEISVDEDIAEIYFGRSCAPNFYAWILPKGDVCEVGVGVREAKKSPLHYLKTFMEKHPVASGKIKGRSVLEVNMGGIPVSTAANTVAERALIVGDAAGQVKATTGGGVITGGIAARIAGKACVQAVEEKNFSAEFLRRNYEEAWKAKIGFELKVHDAMRRMFDSLSDSRMDEIFEIAIREKVGELMAKYQDTDRPSSFVKELVKKPAMLRIARKFLSLELLRQL